MQRVVITIISLLAYGLFLATFVYLVGFVGDFGVPRTINSGEAPSALLAVVVNLGLVAGFGLQHSIMARQSFKAWWTRFVPKAAERSVYVVATCAVLGCLFAFWQPLPYMLWSVDAPWARYLLWGLFGLGLGLVLLSTFLIDHFEMFGLKQALRNLTGKLYTPPAFEESSLYRLVRHPLYLGLLIFLWLGPEMSAGRALFAAAMTVYVLIGIQYEERDLVRFHGQDYVDYRKRVPMLVPRPRSADGVSRNPTASP